MAGKDYAAIRSGGGKGSGGIGGGTHPHLAALLEATGASEMLAALERMFPEAALYVVDAEQRILYWSAGAEKVLGFSAGEAVGEHCLRSIRCTDCMQGCGIRSPGVVDGVALTLFGQSGEAVGITKHAAALHDTSGKLIGGIELLLPERAPLRSLPTLSDGDLRSLGELESREPSMHELFRLVERLAGTEVTVLIRGESGTGKELVARAIHAHSPRHERPIVNVNCATLTPSLIESELFGHVRGAFTGAVQDRRGLFREADGGTLFLDEVAELPLEVQASLLRVLQEQKVRPVGGQREVSVDVRVIAATHRSLREEVAAGRFREDLLYRLRVVPVYLPPLRERLRDIPLLARRFIEAIEAREERRVARELSPEALRALLDHTWQGNVRELQNAIEYACAVGQGARLERDDLPPELRGGAALARAGGSVSQRVGVQGGLVAGAPPSLAEASAGPAGEDARARWERTRLRETLEENAWDLAATAEALGISRTTLWRRRRKYGL